MTNVLAFFYPVHLFIRKFSYVINSCYWQVQDCFFYTVRKLLINFLCYVLFKCISIQLFFHQMEKVSVGLCLDFWVQLETFKHQHQTNYSLLSKNSDWSFHPAGMISPMGCCYFQKHIQNVLRQSLCKIVLSTALHIAHTELLHDHGQWQQLLPPFYCQSTLFFLLWSILKSKFLIFYAMPLQ